MTTRPIIIFLAAAALLAITAAGAETLPEPVQALQERGVRIVGQFDNPTGLTAYAGIVNGRPVAIYVTANGEHAVLGRLIDGNGKLVARKKLRQMVAEPISEHIWSQLENSTWVPDGDADAPRTVYVFSDPNCPYCYALWQRSRPWVKSGKVRIRHVMVGLISQSSDNKAAAILAAESPEQALTRNKRNYKEGGVQPMEDIPPDIQSKLTANLKLMRQFGLRGTPAIVYRNDAGRVETRSGLPPKKAMESILGPLPAGTDSGADTQSAGQTARK